MPTSAQSSFRLILPPQFKRLRALSRWKQIKRWPLLWALSVCAFPVAAQQNDAPLSAIDWLSQSIDPVRIAEPPTTAGVTTPQITVTPLDRPSKDGIGLLGSKVTKLPPSIWSSSNETTLVNLVRAERVETLPAIQDFLKILMLAEANPPLGAGPDGMLFLARVDKLLDLGALEQAKALIEAAEPDTAPLFRRWFDVALLTGTEHAACDVVKSTPSIAPTFSARIFCLARNGDWNAAAVTLNSHRALGDITDEEDALIARFLDPELFEGEPPLERPERVSPLVFRMHEAVGEPLITANLPLAFAHADLRTTTAWKSQIEAAERLARHGAVSENVLLDIYTARRPAASGGIWDRADAIQKFDRAMQAGNADQIASTLPDAWNAMKRAQAEVLFAQLYGTALQEITLPPAATDIAFNIGLLSSEYETIANNATDQDPFLIAIAQGTPQEVRVTTPRELAIQAAFNGTPPPDVLQQLVKDGKLGEALLRAVAVFHAGYSGDNRSLTEALALFRSVGLEDLARRSALQLIILDRRT